MPNIKLIVAIDSKQGMSRLSVIPWDTPSDRQYFVDHVEEGPVAMGWNTFVTNSLKPYGKGKNTVITRKHKKVNGVEIATDASEYFKGLREDIWVAGGGQIFKEALPYATHLYLTRIEGDFDCDVYFPEFEKDFVLTYADTPMMENGTRFTYQIWEPSSK